SGEIRQIFPDIPPGYPWPAPCSSMTVGIRAMSNGRHEAASARSLSGTDAAEIASLRARLRRLEQDNLQLLDNERARQQETKALAGIGRLLSQRLQPDGGAPRTADEPR